MGKIVQDACGNVSMKIPPDMGKLKWLMDKFVNDYNEQLGLLEPMGEEDKHKWYLHQQKKML